MSNLSIVIPARNEEWLRRTVEEVLAKTGGRTEVIVICDGNWPDGGLDTHERLQVVKLATPIGQRAATNLGMRLSTSTYCMKLDAHCAVAENFDLHMLEVASQLPPNVCVIPGQYNLHVFDWVCDGCGARAYQGPQPTVCAYDPKELHRKSLYGREGYHERLKPGQPCGGTSFHKDVLWQPRESRFTSSWCFDKDLHFQYWGRGEKQDQQVHDTMSCLGACWMVNREHWMNELGGLDEAHGSWGQMGTEVSCKHWLSGGRLVVNKHTWYAHLFRTQGGDFSFPYEITDAQQAQARAHSNQLWREGTWPLAKRSLRSLVEQFRPKGWSEEDINGLKEAHTANGGPPEPTARPVGGEAPQLRERHPRQPEHRARVHQAHEGRLGAVYYTDGRLAEGIRTAVAEQLSRALGARPLVKVGLVGTKADVDILIDAERGPLTMFRQILMGLLMLDTEWAALVEHDVLYHESHFMVPGDADHYWYNTHTWKVNAQNGKAVTYDTCQTSGLIANRQLLIKHYDKRIARVLAKGFSRRMGFEPGSHNREERVDDIKAKTWTSPYPNIDIRHTTNLTPSRWRQKDFRDQRNCRNWKESDVRNIIGWPDLPSILSL